MKLILLGPPGAGKGTQAEILSNRLGIITISTGVILRAAIREGTELGKIAAQFINDGNLVPDDVVVEIATETTGSIPFSTNETVDNNLKPGETKVVNKARNGYTVNVYQVWQEPGKEDVKSLITVSRYDAIQGKSYVSTQTPTPAPSATPTVTQAPAL